MDVGSIDVIMEPYNVSITSTHCTRLVNFSVLCMAVISLQHANLRQVITYDHGILSITREKELELCSFVC